MSEPSPVAFALNQMTFRYPGGKKPVLSDVTLTIPANQTTVVSGPSGCGKTTLLCLLGLLLEDPLQQGDITYRGSKGSQPYRGMSRAARVRLRRDRFGFVLQASYLLSHLSGVDNIAMPLALQGVSSRERRREAERLLLEADLGGKDGDLAQMRWEKAHRLSGGQRQRVALLRALVHDPQVVFADEPFSNLDRDNADCALEVLKQWLRGDLKVCRAKQQRTLILICHDMEQASKHGDRLVLLDASGTVKCDPPIAMGGLRSSL